MSKTRMMKMMLTIDDLFNKWNNISPFSGGFLLVSDDHPLAFHIGYINDNQKCFVVLNTGKVKKVNSSKAISVENVLIDDGTYSLKFSLNYPSLDEIFIKLCWDLICVSQKDKNPISKIIDQYQKWLKLLSQLSSDLLPIHMQKGLIGELLYLSELIDSLGEENAIDSWVGPEGSDQDFNFDEGWAEVKTTTIAGTSVQISSLQQLDRVEAGKLVVYFMDRILSFGETNFSLDKIVKIIEGKLSKENKFIFSLKLAKSGYQSKDSEKYNEFRFRIAEKRLYNVKSGFPCLTRRTVPVAVIETKYSINLPSIDEYIVKEG